MHQPFLCRHMSLEMSRCRTRGEQLLSNPGLGTNDVVQSLPLAEEQLGNRDSASQTRDLAGSRLMG